MMRQLAIAIVLILGSQAALGDDLNPALPPAGPSLGMGQAPNPYAAAWPPPGASMEPAAGQFGGSLAQTPNPYAPVGPPAGQPVFVPPAGPAATANWIAPASPVAPPVVVAAPASANDSRESTWYYRLDSFFWNERSGGVDFVNEYGPISTLGYVHRSGVERFRAELFGGTVAYDGAAQVFDQQGNEQDIPYHQSFGTNYFGCRGEYDLLIEPAAWSKARLLCGVGTRFWIRDLQDIVLPSNILVSGYQEAWWTFYPYVGVETKTSDEPGLQFFGSARVGITPLTVQYATLLDSNYLRAGNVVYPRCGMTGQMELGVRFQKFTASAFLEGFTWGESAVVGDSYQPASRMLTLGGKIGYTF